MRAIAIFTLLLALPAAGDVLHLREGQRIEGEIQEKGETYEVKTDFGVTVIPKAEVERIVKSASALQSEADIFVEQARAMADEASKDEKGAKEKFKAALEHLKKGVEVYLVIQQNYTGLKYAHVGETLAKLTREMRDWREKANPPAKGPEKTEPEKPPPPPPIPPKPPTKKELEALQAKAKAGDLESIYALAVHLEERERKPTEALKWYVAAADRAHARSQHRIGVLHLRTLADLPLDTKEARRWLEKAVALGLARSEATLGKLAHESGDLLTANKLCEGSLAILREEAGKGDPECQTLLGWMHLEGVGLSPDAAKAFALFKAAAEYGYGPAQVRLGRACEDGAGTEKNEKEAASWYQKAADQGDEEGLLAAAAALRDGLGGAKKDPARAVELYRKGVEQGSGFARMRMGRMLAAGEGVPRRDTEAFQLLRKAADQMLLGAIEEVALFYAAGRGGIKRDPDQAARWNRVAADQGSLAAYLQLGKDALQEKQFKQAANYYRAAAQRGVAEAQRQMGLLHEKGQGVEKDPQAARWWHLSAAQQGDEAARESLKKLGLRAR